MTEAGRAGDQAWTPTRLTATPTTFAANSSSAASEIAYRYHGHGSGFGRHRWVVERTFAWLHNRRHSSLDYLSPLEYESQHYDGHTITNP